MGIIYGNKEPEKELENYGLIKEIENKAAQYNFSKDNLLERFTAIVAVPTRKGIEDWRKKEIFVPEEHNNELFNLL